MPNNMNGKGSKSRITCLKTYKENFDQINWGRNSDNLTLQDTEATVTDGYQVWPRKCCMCGQNTIYVVRPGKIQCGNCD